MGPAKVMDSGTPRYLHISTLEHANLVALLANRSAKNEVRLAVTTHTMVSSKIGPGTRIAVHTLLDMMRVLHRTASALVSVADALASDLLEITGVPKESINIIRKPFRRA